MTAYCEQNPRHARASHGMSARLDEDIAYERRAFERCQGYFGIPDE